MLGTLVFYMRDLVEDQLKTRYSNPDERLVFYAPKIMGSVYYMNYWDKSPEKLRELEDKFKSLPRMWHEFFFYHARYPWFKDLNFLQL